MHYHGHLPARLLVKDIYFHTVCVERQTSGLTLNGQPTKGINRHPDGTIELVTEAPEAPEQLLRYHFHGFQYWQMLHDDEQPSQEYTGQLEAQLAHIRQICNAQFEDAPRSYAIGGCIDSSNEMI